jgi:hypothetical protein
MTGANNKPKSNVSREKMLTKRVILSSDSASVVTGKSACRFSPLKVTSTRFFDQADISRPCSCLCETIRTNRSKPLPKSSIELGSGTAENAPLKRTLSTAWVKLIALEKLSPEFNDMPAGAVNVIV